MAVQSDGSAAAAAKAAAVAPAVYDRKLARRADISVTVSDVDAAAAKVRVIAASAKGLVVAEAISSEPDDPALGGFSTITISVPTDQLDATLDRLAELGKVHSRNASTDDVTAQYVDTESRVKTMEASVAPGARADDPGHQALRDRRAGGRAHPPPGRPRGHPDPARRPRRRRGARSRGGAPQHRREGARGGRRRHRLPRRAHRRLDRVHRVGDRAAHRHRRGAPVRRRGRPGARAPGGLAASPHLVHLAARRRPPCSPPPAA